jgi:hypothetical protein
MQANSTTPGDASGKHPPDAPREASRQPDASSSAEQSPEQSPEQSDQAGASSSALSPAPNPADPTPLPRYAPLYPDSHQEGDLEAPPDISINEVDPAAPTQPWRPGEEAATAAQRQPESYYPPLYTPAGHAGPDVYPALDSLPPVEPRQSAAGASRPRASAYPAQPPYTPPAYRLPDAIRQRRGIPPTVGVVAAAVIVTVFVLVLVGRALQQPRTAVLYENPMKAATSGWRDDPLRRDCFFKSDGYHIVTATNCYYADADYGDVTLSATVRLAAGDTHGAFGLAFRRPTKDNFYAFYITGTGSWFAAKQETILRQSQPNSAIKTGVGAVNHLEVRMQGSHFDFSVNGVRVGSLDDSAYREGKVGLVGDQNLEVVFTDFKVTQG